MDVEVNGGSRMQYIRTSIRRFYYLRRNKNTLGEVLKCMSMQIILFYFIFSYYTSGLKDLMLDLGLGKVR